MEPGQDDGGLIARVVSRDDQTAFEMLVRNHQSPVRNFLRRLTAGDAMTADDLAQETFVKAYRKIGSFAGRGSFRSWLYQIAYNEFLQHRRRNRHFTEELDENRTPERMSMAEKDRAFDARHDVTRAMKDLNEDERTAITLCFTDGYSHAEASEIMDMPLGTVKSHIARGKEKLRISLKAWQSEVTS